MGNEVKARLERFHDSLNVNRHYMTGQSCREVQADLRVLLDHVASIRIEPEAADRGVSEARIRLPDSRRAWLAVKQSRQNYEADLLARIEELMDAEAGTPEGDELRTLADELASHETEQLGDWDQSLRFEQEDGR